MNKFLLISAFSMGVMVFGANAQTQYYAGDPDSVYGLLTGISDNGKYAVAADEEDNYSYMWNEENPAEFQLIRDKSLLYDVSDTGVAVGATFDGTQFRAAIFKDGEWLQLPSHPEVLNEQYAICITPDGSIISGYEFDLADDADQGGRYYPVVWTLDAQTGEYEIEKFNDLILPDHQGFITECMTADGRYIGGRLYCGFNSEIPAIIDIANHSIKYWNDLEVRLEPWQYKGKYEGRDENGKQIWLEDKDDPRVVLYEEQYIDGLHNNSDETSFSGEFIGVDVKGNFYGHRSIVANVSEDGETGEMMRGACIYNVETDTFTDFEGISTFSIGYDNATKLFAADARMVIVDESGEAKSESIFDGLGFSTSDEISAITKGSADGKVLGGIYGIFNPAKQAPDYHPFMLILDNPLTGISEITIGDGSDIMIIVANGRIEVANAQAVAIYNLGGRLISSTSCSVAPGAYIVKADNISKKVIVK